MTKNTIEKSLKENPPIHQTTIDSLSHEGRGIAHINNKIAFLENALPGEDVNFTYTKHHSKFSNGKVTEILKSSADRVTPCCKHYDICGGCSLQHLKHDKQIAFKTQVLREQLKHIGGLEIKNLLAPIIGPDLGYRSKARLSVKYVQKKGKLLVGFHEKNGVYIAEMEECQILHPTVGKKISNLSKLIANLSIYQHIPQIEVACGDNITALVFRNLQKFSDADIALLKKFGDEHQFKIYSQSGGADTVASIDSDLEHSPLSYKLPNKNIEIIFNPTDFTQINHPINTQMVDHVLELLEIKPDEKILDLFCGIGNFTLPIATKCLKVIGVEGNKNAVLRAIQNAKHNNIESLELTNNSRSEITNLVEFYVADLTKELSALPWGQQQYDKILLDPPRTGAIEICSEIKKFNAKKIVYVSCNPATLARDAKKIVEQGYKLQTVTLIDMYPHTSHMEAVASFELN